MKQILLTVISSTLSLLTAAQFCSGFLVNINVTSGSFPGEISWQLKNGSTTLLSGGAPFTGQACIPNLCQNYTLVMNDTFGDGWNGANFTMSYSTWSNSTTLNTGSTGSAPLYAGVLGCTDAFACNYNVSATCNSGCIYGFAGCNDPAACNFEPLACFNDGSCCYNSCIVLGMTDSFGDGWNGGTYNVRNSVGITLYSGTLATTSSGSAKFCLPNGCYTLEITGGSFPAEIGWTLAGDVAGEQLSGGAPVNISFHTNNTIVGCTSEWACNYNPAALCDNGTCIFGFAGCTDPSSCSYDAWACVDDGSCLDIMYMTATLQDMNANGWSGVQAGIFTSGSSDPIIVLSMPPGLFETQVTYCIPAGCYVIQPLLATGEPDGDEYIDLYFEDNTFFDDITLGLVGFNVGETISGCVYTEASDFDPQANCSNYNCCFDETVNVTITGLDPGEAPSLSFYYNGELFVTETISNNSPYASFCLPEGCCTYIWTVPAGNQFSWQLYGSSIDTATGTELQHTGGIIIGDISYGCTDAVANNFDPFACADNGSCCYQNSVSVEIHRSFSDYPYSQELYYILYDELGNEIIHIVLPAGVTTNLETYSEYAVPQYCIPNGCYTYFTNMTSENTISYLVFHDVHNMADALEVQPYTYLTELPQPFGFEDGNFTTSSGCTDPFACNYEPDAFCDNGSCLYGFLGCTDSNACNYNPLACMDNGTCNYGNAISFEIHNATQPGTFEIYPHTPATDYDAPNYLLDEVITVSYGAATLQTIIVCLPDGCYDLWHEEGATPAGFSYSVFGFSHVFNNLPVTVGLVGVETGNVVAGCTTEGACNYNVLANCDDGSCTFDGEEHCMHLHIEDILGSGLYTDEACMESIVFTILDFEGNTVLTYSPESHPVEDYWFTLPSGCYGLYVEQGVFCSFNFTLTGQNGSVIVGDEDFVFFAFNVGEDGCTDPNALNYNPNLCYLLSDNSLCCYEVAAYVYLYDNPLDGWHGPYANIYDHNNDLVYSHYMQYGDYDFVDQPCLPQGCYTYEIGTQFLLEFPENTLYIIGENGDTDQGTIPATGSFIIGTNCSDEFACNYNPAVTCYDSSGCIYGFLGCTDPASCDYEPLACANDGSCYEHLEVNVHIEFTPLANPVDGPFSFSVYDQTGGPSLLPILEYTVPFSNEILSYHFCLGDGCYQLRSPNVNSLEFESILIQLGFFYLPEVSVGFDGIGGQYLYTDFEVGNVQSGCTDPFATNYDPAATCHIQSECCYQVPATIGITNHNAGTEAGFLLLVNDEVYGVYETAGGSFLRQECLPPGCYQLVPNMGAGVDYTFTIVTPSGVISGTEGSTTQFLVIGESTGGCLDTEANNYHPFACFDDGSCCYDANVFIALIRYSGSTPCSLTIRDSDEVVVAQSNLAAGQNNNYEDGYDFVCLPDGCYTYEFAPSDGFTDIIIMNEVDHSLYDYQHLNGTFVPLISGNHFEILNGAFSTGGCTNPAACNFSPGHSCDDGSCTTSCFGDLDCNGVVNTSDLLLFMSAFGCMPSCGIADLNGDGVVNTTDLLLFMSGFGNTCN